MDYRKLKLHHEFFNLGGYCLTLRERTNLQNSLVLLQRDGHFSYVLYWGKIMGVKQDYHVCLGYAKTLMEEYTKFYSVDGGLSWKQLSTYDEDLVQYLSKTHGYFHGDPSQLYVFDRIRTTEEIELEELRVKEEESERLRKIEEEKKKQLEKEEERRKKREEEDLGEDSEDEGEGMEEEGEEDLGEDGEEEEEGEEGEGEGGRKKKKKELRELVKITEEIRLSYTIDSIYFETNVVPRGSFVKNTDNIIVPNLIFQGLEKYQAGKLESYMHLRPPNRKKGTLEKHFSEKAVDFCDTLDDDIPNNCWVLKYNPSQNMIVGSSLLWPGYVFYHQPKSNVYGMFYMGNGLKNLDLCFML